MKTLNDALGTSKLICLALSRVDNRIYTLTDLVVTLTFETPVSKQEGVGYHGFIGNLEAHEPTLSLLLLNLLKQARTQLQQQTFS